MYGNIGVLCVLSIYRSGWNYRITATRVVSVKSKNECLRKALAIDLSSGIPFVFVISDVSVEALEVEKEFSATLKVYTSKNVGDVEKEFVEFFEVLDVDQSFEDFVNVYWLYPNNVLFELSGIEPL